MGLIDQQNFQPDRVRSERSECPSHAICGDTRCFLRKCIRELPLRVVDYGICQNQWGIPIYLTMETIRQSKMDVFILSMLDKMEAIALEYKLNKSLVGLVLGQNGVLRWGVRNVGASAAPWGAMFAAPLTELCENPENAKCVFEKANGLLKWGMGKLCRKRVLVAQEEGLLVEQAVLEYQSPSAEENQG